MKHLGPKATQIVARGGVSELYEYNKKVTKLNEHIEQLQEQINFEIVHKKDLEATEPIDFAPQTNTIKNAIAAVNRSIDTSVELTRNTLEKAKDGVVAFAGNVVERAKVKIDEKTRPLATNERLERYNKKDYSNRFNHFESLDALSNIAKFAKITNAFVSSLNEQKSSKLSLFKSKEIMDSEMDLDVAAAIAHKYFGTSKPNGTIEEVGQKLLVELAKKEELTKLRAAERKASKVNAAKPEQKQSPKHTLDLQPLQHQSAGISEKIIDTDRRIKEQRRVKRNSVKNRKSQER